MFDEMFSPQLFEDLITEIVAAGQDAVRLFELGAAQTFRKKPDRSPVTQADDVIEARLREFLHRASPGVEFLGEESATGTEHLQPSAGPRMIVDPIDGTRAFLRGFPTWSILVGVEVNAEPVLGVAHLPVTGEIYWAKKGEGAYRRMAGSHQDIRLAVSKITKLEDACIAHGALLQFTLANIASPLLSLTETTYSLRGMQDFSGHQAVLEGRAEAMIDPDLKPWDMCAVSVLVREAGGMFTSLSGVSTIYEGTALSSNGRVHNELIQTFTR